MGRDGHSRTISEADGDASLYDPEEVGPAGRVAEGPLVYGAVPPPKGDSLCAARRKGVPTARNR